MPRLNRHRSTFVPGILLVLAACGSSTSPSQPSAITALPRALSSAEQATVTSSSAFSFALIHRLNAAAPDSSFFLSPLSVSMALGMTLNGAADATFDAMRLAMQFGTTPQEPINAGYRDLIALLRGLDPMTDFRIANSVWYRQDFPFESSFLTTTQNYFGAEVRGLDFAAPSSLATINDWVSRSTSGRIPTILDAIEPDKVMFLINAIYFKAQWRDRFDLAETHTDVFHTRSGGSQQVPFMHRQDTIAYAHTATADLAELRYGNDAFAMDVVLPAEGVNLESYIASLDEPSWNGLLSQLNEREIDLYLPKLTFAYDRELKNDLTALGMGVAFSPGLADFSRLSSRGHELYIAFVKHKAWVTIDEEGTEAAAATSVGIGLTSAPVIPVMRVNRPYLFVIRERFSGTILFVGKISAVPAA